MCYFFFTAARKLTRSSSARIRKSKHVLGKNISDSESESEATTGAGAANTTKSSGGSASAAAAVPSGKRKPTSSKGKASSATASTSSSGRKKNDPKDQSASSYSGGSAPSSQEGRSSPVVEERKCPMAGCDSTGHLNGKSERHLSLQGCPSYHNLTMAECTILSQKAESQLSHWASITTSNQ